MFDRAVRRLLYNKGIIDFWHVMRGQFLRGLGHDYDVSVIDSEELFGVFLKENIQGKVMG